MNLPHETEPVQSKSKRTMADECRECGGDSRVLKTDRRVLKIWRRRECVECGHRWSTAERQSA